MIKFNTDEIEIITLPKMTVIFFKDFSYEPEMKTEVMVNDWLSKHDLEAKKDSIRILGFDCDEFPTNRPDGKHSYGRYVCVPDNVTPDNEDENIKTFKGGNYARLTVTDPFNGNFPDGWNKLIEWASANGYKNKNVCKSTGRCNPCKKNCWNSTEDEPDFEELYEKNGVQYMDFYLPIE